MKLKVIVDKNIAFSGFVRNVAHLGKYEWIEKWQKELAKTVPLKLAKQSSIIFQSRLSYERHPKSDMVEWNKETHSVLKKLEKIHNKEWKIFEQNVQVCANTFNDIINKYSSFILNQIPKFTKISWNYEEAWLIPSIYRGSTTEDNKIFVGVCRPLNELNNVESRMSALIHELIHVNEQPKYLSRFNQEELLGYVLMEQSKFKSPNMSREITTMLLTEEISNIIEKKFNVKLDIAKSHPHYKKINVNAIRKKIKFMKGFERIRKIVDKSLIK